jgi:hypothetical protein
MSLGQQNWGRLMGKKPRPAVDLSLALKSLKSTTVTSKNIFETLDSIRDAWGGVHKARYRLMGHCWKVVLLLRRDKERKGEFIRRAKLKAKKGKKNNIAEAVIGYMMRAKTASDKKMAWKYSRVLQFLHDQGVRPNRMQREIEARGGIEKICEEAIKQAPRRKSKAATKKRPAVAKLQRNDLEIHADKDDDFEAKSPRTNDQALTIELGIKLSDRDELFEMPKGAKARLTIKRTDSQNGVKVLRLQQLRVNSKSEDW